MYERSTMRVVLPFHIAVKHGSLRVSKLLIDMGVDVYCQSDYHNDNVLHSCVLAGFNLPKIENGVCTMVDFLLDELGEECVFQLLQSENREKLTPLKFAA